jgi:hypothetical protein
MLFKFALGIKFLSFGLSALSALSSKNQKKKTFANWIILGASFAHEIWHLFLSQGLAFGFGMGVCAFFHTKLAFGEFRESQEQRPVSRTFQGACTIASSRSGFRLFLGSRVLP